MRNVFRMAALAAAIASVGLAHPATAKPKDKHGQGHDTYAAQVAGQPGQQYMSQQQRGPGYSTGGAAMMQPGGMQPGMQPGMMPGSGGHAAPQGGYGGGQPPGWSHGAKRGWHGHHMPPGLYKKYYP